MNKILLLTLFSLAFSSAYTQVTGNFIVKGDVNTYYPVLFTDGGWANNTATEMTLGRSLVHGDATWRGALIAKFRFHCTDWGNGAQFIDADLRQNTTSSPTIKNFVGGWFDASYLNTNSQILIWLRGGTTTYYYTSNYAVNPIVYDGVQNSLPVTVNGSPTNSKTIPDSYVDVQGINTANDINAGGNLLVTGTGLNYFNGAVGIGTNTPGTNKLAVEGTIAARKVIVTATGTPFPDYVFKKGYDLPTLDSVSKFISSNNHLPEVPSADSVGRSGLDVGNMQSILLKKIEELTLYAIEQNEKIKELDSQLLRQNKKIKELELDNNTLKSLDQKIAALVEMVKAKNSSSK